MKLAGAICVLLGFLGNGFLSYQKWKKKYQEKVYIKQILNIFMNLTERENLPFPETCLQCAERLKPEYAKVFQGLYERLESSKAPINSCWEQAVRELSALAGLEREDERILSRIIPNLSFLSSFSPADSIGLVLEEWDKSIESAREKMKQNGRLTLALNFSAGLFICLIFA